MPGRGWPLVWSGCVRLARSRQPLLRSQVSSPSGWPPVRWRQPRQFRCGAASAVATWPPGQPQTGAPQTRRRNRDQGHKRRRSESSASARLQLDRKRTTAGACQPCGCGVWQHGRAGGPSWPQRPPKSGANPAALAGRNRRTRQSSCSACPPPPKAERRGWLRFLGTRLGGWPPPRQTRWQGWKTPADAKAGPIRKSPVWGC